LIYALVMTTALVMMVTCLINASRPDAPTVAEPPPIPAVDGSKNFDLPAASKVQISTAGPSEVPRYRAAQRRSPSSRCVAQYHALAGCAGLPGGPKP
jgi:hypothetical protein